MVNWKVNNKYKKDVKAYHYNRLPDLFSIWIAYVYNYGSTLERYTVGNSLSRSYALPVYRRTVYKYIHGEFTGLDISTIEYMRIQIMHLGYPDSLTLGQFVDLRGVLIPDPTNKGEYIIYNPTKHRYKIKERCRPKTR